MSIIIIDVTRLGNNNIIMTPPGFVNVCMYGEIFLWMRVFFFSLNIYFIHIIFWRMFVGYNIIIYYYEFLIIETYVND